MLARHIGHPIFLFLISFKQEMHPATCPQGTHAASADASTQITHTPDPPLPSLLSKFVDGNDG